MAGAPGDVHVHDWADDAALSAAQARLGQVEPPAWMPGPGPLTAAGCFVAFARGEQGPGHAGDRAWVGAVVVADDGVVIEEVVITGAAEAPYEPGVLARREGTMLLRALERLQARPDVLLVDSTGRDHPRRAGLALHLGAILDVPSIGVTHRPLTVMEEPPDLRERGEWRAVVSDGEEVARWVCTSPNARPVVAHAGWRTSAATAADVAVRFALTARTPEPLRLARCQAREARSAATVSGRRP